MLPHELLNDFVQKASKVVESASGSTQAAGKQLSVMAHHFFKEMDLVPRNEFDAQAAVLQRTRERLEQLESELDVLRRQLDGDK